MKRTRVDELLVAQGLARHLQEARARVLAGEVFVGERRLDKPGTTVPPDTSLLLRSRRPDWVSRGALKLLHGLDHFGLDPSGRAAIDVGASTGGFTEVLLARGANHVYAVDVGYGQLDAKLRGDPRVVVMERTNARHIDRTTIAGPIGAVVCDASFIGLRQVLPAALACAVPGAFLVALIKPQFEVAREQVGRGGVVRDPELHEAVCQEAAAWLPTLGWAVRGVDASPVLGPKGNREFLIAAHKTGG
ncbi:MAG: TlyA family RNA methyltransferase [Pseudomonadota bacterium]